MTSAREEAHRNWVWTRNWVEDALAEYGAEITMGKVRASVARRLAEGDWVGETDYYTRAIPWVLERLDETCALVRPSDTVASLRQRLNTLVEDPRHPEYREESYIRPPGAAPGRRTRM